MKDGIQLHPTLGVNARMSRCPHCNVDNPELLLLGIANYVFDCPKCESKTYGIKKATKVCPQCHENSSGGLRELGEREKLEYLCESCNKKRTDEAQMFADVVAQGGIYFQCEDCKAEGVLKPSPYTELVRKKADKPTGPLGVIFDKNRCPQCGAKEEAKDATSGS